MTPEERRAKAFSIVNSIAKDLKEVVEVIEKGDPLTQDNYDKYMLVIDQMSEGNDGMKYAIATALILAGANAKGVRAAIKLTV